MVTVALMIGILQFLSNLKQMRDLKKQDTFDKIDL